MKPGDIVIVTDPSSELTYGRECLVSRVDATIYVFDHSINYIWAVRKEDPGEFRLAPWQYELLEEDGAKIEVGDRVIVTDRVVGDGWGIYCGVFIVATIRLSIGVDVVFSEGDSGGYTLLSGAFRLLKRESKTPSSSSCPDCNSTGKIQLFTSTVKCHCKEIEI